jgi:hypothetical protein
VSFKNRITDSVCEPPAVATTSPVPVITCFDE